jgi:AraC-like DNA-binding protein
MNILFAIGIAQGLFFIFFLFGKKENVVANRLLITLLVFITLSLSLNYLYSTGLINRYPHLIGLDNTTPFLFPPLIYFYIKVLVAKQHRFRSIDLLHLLPFAIYFLYVLFTFYLKSGEYKLEFLNQIRNVGIPLDLTISSFLKIVQAVVYLIFAFRIIQKHRENLKQQFSYTENISLTWLKVITMSMMTIYLIHLIGLIIPFLFDQVDLGFVEQIMELFNVVFIYIMAYYGVQQPQIFKKWHLDTPTPSPSLQPITPQKEEVSSEDKKYAKSLLTSEESKRILKRLQDYMASEQPYLQNQLTIKELADSLKISPKYLSQVINEQLGLNFFNFINQYRVEEVKKRLTDKKYEHLSMLGIALDCGFNSKSSFNSVFKSQTGLTPSGYISATS